MPTNGDSQREPLKVADVAKMFGVSNRTVQRWVEDDIWNDYGVNPWVTPGGDLRFYRDEVEAAIERNRKNRGNSLRKELLKIGPIERAQVVTIANQKGGCGKTTVAVNLAAALSKTAGSRVLVIDMDPQGNATRNLGFSDHITGYQSYDYVVGDLWNSQLEGDESEPVPLIDIIAPIDDDERLWLAPNDTASNAVEHALLVSMLQLASQEGPLDQGRVRGALRQYFLTLRTALDELLAEEPFDWVILDTGPSVGALTTAAMLASDYYLIPCEPEPFSVQGLGQFEEIVNSTMSIPGHKLELVGYLINHSRRGAKMRKNMAKAIRENAGDRVFKTELPENVPIGESQQKGKPVVTYKPESPAAETFLQLANEVMQRIGLEDIEPPTEATA